MPLQPTTPLDAIFAKNAGPIPAGFLRVLAYKESGFRPDVVHPTSKATGLFQITNSALSSFNQRNSAGLSLAHLTDPDLNTRVAVQHLASVINVYKRYRSLQPDWTSRRWLELLTLGWNAGHNAVAQIVGRMESTGLPDDRINVDTVSQAAAAIGGSARFVADPARVSWAKSVAATYLGGSAPRGLYASMVPIPESTTGKVFFILSGLALAAYGLAQKAKEYRR